MNKIEALSAKTPGQAESEAESEEESNQTHDEEPPTKFPKESDLIGTQEIQS